MQSVTENTFSILKVNGQICVMVLNHMNFNDVRMSSPIKTISTNVGLCA